MESSIYDGVIIGGAGGALAGVTVYLIQFLHNFVKDQCDKKKVYRWLENETSNNPGMKFRSTRAIASWNNLTEDRTRYICSIEKRIYPQVKKMICGAFTKEKIVMAIQAN